MRRRPGRAAVHRRGHCQLRARVNPVFFVPKRAADAEELGDLSVLELEVALAALMGKRILAFELSAESQDPRMLGLVDSLHPKKRGRTWRRLRVRASGEGMR